MKTLKWCSILAAAPLIGLTACSGQGSLDYQMLVARLRASGATVVTVSDGAEWPLSGSEQSLKVNGEEVEVYSYASQQAANADAAGIAPDGLTMVEGVAGGQETMTIAQATPHFFKKGALIVYYGGNNSEVLSLLQAALGSQMAGAG